MSDLTEFLLARIAEDEHRAKQAWAGGHRGTRWLGEPDRQLAECEAKRKIIEAHPPLFGGCETCHELDAHDAYDPCVTLRALAQPYADHPDFDPAWRLS